MMTTALYSLPSYYALEQRTSSRQAAALENCVGVLLEREKRGGLRVIYYWHKTEECIYMLLIYRKSRQDDLTQEQLKILRKLVKENLK
jgi:hypothetical protein